MTFSLSSATKVAIMMKTAIELMARLGERSRERRLALNLSRAGLGVRSGVSVAVIRQFESTGKISLESFIKLAIALGAGEEIDRLLSSSNSDEVVSIDELIRQSMPRKRGRLR